MIEVIVMVNIKIFLLWIEILFVVYVSGYLRNENCLYCCDGYMIIKF